MQVEALGLALGLLYLHGQGLRRWRDVEAETCHPWPAATFWRSANALGARLHVVLTDKALQVSAPPGRSRQCHAGHMTWPSARILGHNDHLFQLVSLTVHCGTRRQLL